MSLATAAGGLQGELESLRGQLEHLRGIVASLPTNSQQLGSDVLDLKAEVAALAETGFANQPADSYASRASGSTEIPAEGVTTEKLAKEAVTFPKLAAGAALANLAAESITGAKVAKETLAGEKLVKGTIGETQLAAGENSKINVGAFSAVSEVNAKLTVNATIEAREEHTSVGRLKGHATAKEGIAAATKLFKLPAGTLPKAETKPLIVQHGVFVLEFRENGEVLLQGGELKALEELFLDGITWPL